MPAPEQGGKRGPGRPPLTPEHLTEVRMRVASAALDLFADHGYEQTRVDDIAERAGVSSRTLWRLFDSKAACLVPVARETLGGGLVQLVSGWPPGTTFGDYFSGVVPIARAEPISHTASTFIRLLRDEPGLDTMMARSTRAIEEDLAVALAERLDLGAETVEVRSAAAVLNAVFRAALEAVALDESEPDNDRLLETVARALWCVAL